MTLSMTDSGAILTDAEAKALKHATDEDWCDALAYPVAISTASRYAENREDKDDMAQTAIFHLWRQRPRIDAAVSPMGYAFSAARTACLNWLEREKGKRERVARAILERARDE